MSSKVILLKYLAPDRSRVRSSAHLGGAGGGAPTKSPGCIDRTAIIVKKCDGLISIQGYPPVHQSEKHRAWTIFQHAAKQLLGIASSTPICTRFSDPPQETVGSLSSLFHQPSHLINLDVQPICSTASTTDAAKATNLLNAAAVEVSVGGRDPYCVYREQYCSSSSKPKLQQQHLPPIRAKCNFAEMNRLISQLSEVSICLQRTKQECELIEKRCRKESKIQPKVGDSSGVPCSGVPSKSALVKLGHSISSSSYGSDSGKGSMVDYEILEGVREEEEMDCGPQGTASPEGTEGGAARDKEVERLLNIAQCLTQQALQQQQRKGSPGCTLLSSAAHSASSRPQTATDLSHPEPPTQVMVRPSFRHGGAYVMWDPVSVDGEERNNGLKVLGYQVYLDGHMYGRAEGALASQLELTAMKNHREYSIQVSTECEGCSSALTEGVIYRHLETNQLLSSHDSLLEQEASPNLQSCTKQSDTTISSGDGGMGGGAGGVAPPTTPTTHSNSCKVARVHSWLKCSPLTSPPPPPLGKDHTHSLKDHTPSTTLHVHFAEEEEICGCTEDTRSTGSSHTSGIVTDCPSSPKLLPTSPKLLPSSPKLLPSCSCAQCSDFSCSFSTATTATTPTTTATAAPGHSDCTNQDLSRSDELEASTDTVDAVIDMPLDLVDTTHHQQQSRPLHTSSSSSSGSTPRDCRHASKLHSCTTSDRDTAPSARDASSVRDLSGPVGGKMVTRNNSRRFVVAPEPPTNVYITRGAKRNGYIISWKPVRRDSKGCSNGLYVLGYRIYVEGSCWKSVDGALTAQATLTLPSTSVSQLQQHQINIHIRTRSMSAESAPSEVATYQDRCRPKRHEQIVSVKRRLLTTYV